MSSLAGVPVEDLEAIGVPEEYIEAAQEVRANFRQGLATAFDGASEGLESLQNSTAAFRVGNLSIGNGTLLESMIRSGVPVVLAEDGERCVYKVVGYM